MSNVIKKFFSNKIVLYMSSRYITYILSFIVNIYIAGLLGPTYYGIWAFLLMVFHYFNVVELGIPNAVQVLLVQNKDKKDVSASIEKTGTVLIAVLSLVTIVIASYYSFGGISKAHELNVGWLFYAICLCGFLNYFTSLYDKIYRCRNRLFELGYKQTSVVFLLAFSVLFFRGENLLYGLVISYIVWCGSSFLLFITRGGLVMSGSFRKEIAVLIINKGIYLFLFYSGFSLIMITTRTFISTNYTIDEFGCFSFAYLLGHAVFQCVQAFSVVTITKLIDRYHSPEKSIVLSTIRIVRENYVTMFHFVIYIAMLVFPLVVHFLPKYSSALVSMNLCALMMILYTNAYGYSTYLVASNKEKKLALIAVSSFLLNVVLCVVLIKLLHVKYDYVVFSTMVAYMFYAYLCSYFGRGELNLSTNFISVLLDCFPFKLLVPFVIAVSIALVNKQQFVFLPVLVFVIMNLATMTSMYKMIKKMIINPQIVDI